MEVYVVNAFAESRFGGNPAAVVSLPGWLPEKEMQQIASQNNLSETAFIVPQGEDYAIRWFTPTLEVALCGHATLASAHVFFSHLGYGKDHITFHSKSGPLHVTKKEDGKIMLDFPADKPVKSTAPENLVRGLKVHPVEVYKSSFDEIIVLDNQEQIEKLAPDFSLLKLVPSRGVLITAKGDDVDFVSRCFFPQSGIDEDPVTGSAHTSLTPLWAEKLGKNRLTAIQLSARRGYLDCEWADKRVLMSGRAHTYLIGKFFI